METRIEAYALQNAVRYGSAMTGKVIPKILGEFPEQRSQMPTLKQTIDAIVERVNAMSAEERLARLNEIAPEMLEKRPERTDNLKELDGAQDGVVMRFAPSPSGPMHLGHAMTGGLTSLYVGRYGGKFLLRIEDTNSDNIYPPAYEMLPEDARWLFGNVSEVWIQSDRMEIYYSYVERFLEKDAIYVCECSQERFKQFADSQEDCPCRDLPNEEQRARWRRMLDTNGYKEGECVVRFKSGMQHKNPAMRDFPLLRINESPHPRQGTKYRVWPLMNFSVLVDDIEGGMTHVIRAKDHADNAKRQEMMYAILGKTPPKAYFVGRYNFEGLELSASKTRAKIEEGAYEGWDDIRLPFMAALRRRGYRPEVFLRYTKLTGLSLVDKTVSAEEFYKTIDAFDRELLDPIAKRFSFVEDPQEVRIEGVEPHEARLDAFPDQKDGSRVLPSEGVYLLRADDLAAIGDGPIRLKDDLTFKREGDGFVFLTREHRKEERCKTINWLPVGGQVPVEILMPDGSTKTGVGEQGLAGLAIGEVVMFERFGFCRLDSTQDGVYRFWYTHA